jgi:Zn-dependent protease
VAPTLLRCPGCRRLVHREALEHLAQTAQQATDGGDSIAALTAWREALTLLPPDAQQHQAIQSKIEALSRDAGAADKPRPSDWRSGALKGGGVGTLGLLAWKFKFVVAYVLTKGKFLLLGLTKAGTFLTMLASLGVYWAAWGWKFGLGLVVSIYIHEMGHVFALHQLGIKADAPMFVPGIGAFVRLKQAPASPREDARVGLAGPWWGMGAAVAAYAVALATQWPSWAAMAKFGAWINLFNLLPVWQLDGGRAFHSLTRSHRWLIAAALGVCWWATGEGLLVLLLIGAVIQAVRHDDVEEDTGILFQYLALAGILAWLTRIHVTL